MQAAQVIRTAREYLAELEMQNPVEEPTHTRADDYIGPAESASRTVNKSDFQSFRSYKAP
jgi:hypothetical protein